MNNFPSNSTIYIKKYLCENIYKAAYMYVFTIEFTGPFMSCQLFVIVEYSRLYIP